jgi:hypothetical protein
MPFTVARSDSNSELCAKAVVGSKKMKPHRANAALRCGDADKENIRDLPPKQTSHPLKRNATIEGRRM